MEALLKHGDRVIPESGVSNLDIELKRLKNESIDLFHRGVATKEFVNMKDAKRLHEAGILNRASNGSIGFTWGGFCKLNLKRTTNIVNKRKRFLELKEDEAIPEKGMGIRIYQETSDGVEVITAKIKQADLDMHIMRSSCIIEMAHDANETREIELISVSKNANTKEKPFSEYEMNMVDKLVKKTHKKIQLTSLSDDDSEEDHKTADLCREMDGLVGLLNCFHQL